MGKLSTYITMILDYFGELFPNLAPHLVDGIEGQFARLALLLRSLGGLQPFVYCFDQQRQSRDPLHRQHEEGVHGQRLAHWTRFQVAQGFHKLWIFGPEEDII